MRDGEKVLCPVLLVPLLPTIVVMVQEYFFPRGVADDERRHGDWMGLVRVVYIFESNQFSHLLLSFHIQ